MKQKWILTLSALAGVLAFFLTSHYFRVKMQSIEDARRELYAGLKQVWVVAAGRELPAGSILQREDLLQKQSPERDVGKNTVRPEDVDQLIGKKLKNGLERGETLLWSFVDVPYAPGSGLAPMIRAGMRAISVSVSGASAVSSLVQPNDRVNVLGTFYFPSKTSQGEMEAVTLTMLQDVTVLATGQTIGKQAGDADRRGPLSYGTVTFEVTPREAELLVFAETMKGRLSLALRNPNDASYEHDLPEVNFDHLQKKLPEFNTYRQQNIHHKRDLSPPVSGRTP